MGRPTTHTAAANQRLKKLLESLGVPSPFVLVGHSWGGALARYFAGEYPQLLQAILYIDPTDVTMTEADVAADVRILRCNRKRSRCVFCGDGYVHQERAGCGSCRGVGHDRSPASANTRRASLEAGAEDSVLGATLPVAWHRCPTEWCRSRRRLREGIAERSRQRSSSMGAS